VDLSRDIEALPLPAADRHALAFRPSLPPGDVRFDHFCDIFRTSFSISNYTDFPLAHKKWQVTVRKNTVDESVLRAAMVERMLFALVAKIVRRIDLTMSDIRKYAKEPATGYGILSMVDVSPAASRAFSLAD